MADYLPLAEHKNTSADYRRAQRLRKTSSLAEQILWQELRLACKDKTFRFRRQHPIHPYIADFICLKLHLIIELDGSSHDNRQTYDEKRDAYLKNLGYDVVRFTNDDILTNREGVILTILQRVAKVDL